MAELPDPLTPTECDLRGFVYMPLEVVRLRDSSLAANATGEEFRAAVLLWCASWHQVPAASLPNDDRQLSQLCGFGRGVKDFLKVKDGAMHGWILCSDNRWYHPVIAERAITGWAERESYLEKQQKKKEAARAAAEARWQAEREAKALQEQNERNAEPMRPHTESYADALQTHNNTSCGSTPNAYAIREREGKESKGKGLSPTNLPTSQVRAREGAFPIFGQWEPAEGFWGLAKRSGHTLENPDFADALTEFIAYWLTNPGVSRTQSEWEKSFLQSWKNHRAHASSPDRQPRKRPNGLSPHNDFEKRDYTQGINADGSF